MMWKRILGWVLSGILALVLVVIVGGALFVKTRLFQAYALEKITEQTYASTGATTEIGGMDFSPAALTAHLHNVTLRGTEGRSQHALLQVDKLTVRFTIQSLLIPKIAIRELLIDHPVVHLTNNNQGQNNLPQAPPGQRDSHTSIFDLAIDHVLLTNGEINYNDEKTLLEADLYGLGTDIHFDPFAKRYSGTISYSDGHVRYAGYSALPHELHVTFTATPDQFMLEPLILKVGTSKIVFRAILAGYSNPVANGDYEARIHTEDFAELSPSARPAGDVLLTGRLHYQSSGQGPLLRSIAVQGQIASGALSATSSGTTVQLRKLHGQYQLANGTLRVSDIRLETLGGEIASEAEIQHLDTTPSSRIHARVQGISLRAVQQALQRSNLNGATVSGALDGTADVSWKGTARNARARADFAVRSAANSTDVSRRVIPVNGTVHGMYDGSRESLSLYGTSLRIPAATIIAAGQLSNHANFQIQLAAADLHQFAAFATLFRPGQSVVPAISGSAVLNAVVRGSIRAPEIAGQLSAQNVEMQGNKWITAKLEIQLSPSQCIVRNGVLTAANKGQATFDGRVSLADWSYSPSSQIEANLSVRALQLDDLQRLANQHYPVSGEVSARMSIHGSQEEPIGAGSAQVVNALAYDEPIQSMMLKFNAAKGSVISALNLTTAAGSLNADLTYAPKTRAYQARLDAPALVLQKLRTLHSRNPQLAGTVTASASGEGTLDNPQLTAAIRLPQLELQQRSIAAVNAELKVVDHHADFDLDSRVAQSPVKAHGRVDLNGSYYTEVAVDTGLIPLDQLMATYGQGAPEGLQGQTELHATMRGPLKDMSRLEAHATVPTLAASYRSLQVGIANPIHADYANSVVTLQPVEFSGTGTSLQMQGTMSLRGNASPNLTVQGSVDMRLLGIVMPDAHSSGVVAVDVRTSGTAKKPLLQGQLRVKDVSFATSDAPLGVEKLNGDLDISQERIQISNLKGLVGGGQISIGGSIAYNPSLQFDIAVQGQSIRLRYPEGLSTLLDTNLAFSGSPNASTVNGRVLIGGLTFAPDFDLGKFADQFSIGTTTPTQPGFADTVKLAINVQSKESLSATSSQVSVGGSANLQVGGTAADPVITGRTNLTSGELFFRNVRYELQRGVITLDDPNQTHPVMNVSVTTTVEQYNLTLNMRGPLDKLTVSYESDPPLATADIINLIARGQTTQEASSSSQSTDSMLASGAASELSSSVQKLAGISSLQIDPLLGGNNQNPSARIAIQQRVSKNLFFTFSTDVSQPGSEIVQGEYQINKRWSASVSRDQLGGVSVDGRYHTRF